MKELTKNQIKEVEQAFKDEPMTITTNSLIAFYKNQRGFIDVELYRNQYPQTNKFEIGVYKTTRIIIKNYQ
jgi:hypothetical protein